MWWLDKPSATSAVPTVHLCNVVGRLHGSAAYQYYGNDKAAEFGGINILLAPKLASIFFFSSPIA